MNYNSDIEKLSISSGNYIHPKELLDYINDIKDKLEYSITDYENEIKRLEEENEKLESKVEDLYYENNCLKDKIEELENKYI